MGVPTLELRRARAIKPEPEPERPRPRPIKHHEPSAILENPDLGLLAKWFLIHNLTPRSDHTHADPAHWVDVKRSDKDIERGARIKTICRICNGFVGYRDDKGDQNRKLEENDDSDDVEGPEEDQRKS